MNVMKKRIIPDFYTSNRASKMLEQIRKEYINLCGMTGVIESLILIDQDAKVLAVDYRQNRKLDFFDIASIASALHGVARQGQDFFNASKLVRASIIYTDLKLFVKTIGQVFINEAKGKRDILIVFLVRSQVNEGLIFLIAKKFAGILTEVVSSDPYLIKTLNFSEPELKEEILRLRSDVKAGKSFI